MELEFLLASFCSLFLYLTFCQSVCLFVCLSVYLSVRPTECLSVCLSVSFFVCQSLSLSWFHRSTLTAGSNLYSEIAFASAKLKYQSGGRTDGYEPLLVGVVR